MTNLETIETIVARLKTAHANVETTERDDKPDRWQILEAYGVPARVRSTLRKPLKTKAVESVIGWLASDCWCLILSAHTGVGKSVAAGYWLAKCAASAEIRPQIGRRWWRAGDLVALGGYGSDLDKLGAMDSLVIDDLGAEYADKSGFWLSWLDRLIDHRYSADRRTVITTNLTPEEIKGRYQERISGRLCEGSRWAVWDGKDLRGGIK